MKFLNALYPRASLYPFRCCAIILFFIFARPFSSMAVSSNDVATAIGAYKTAFYNQTGTNGYFKDTQTGGVTYFWGQANIIETFIDAYEWTGDPAYKSMITNLLNGFIKNNGSNWAYNTYNDDILWAVMAFARGGVDSGNPNYCAIAKANFDAVYARAWDSKLGGGLYWDTDNASKNACVNGPGAIAACLLYQIYNDVTYSNKAAAIYSWERSTLFDPGTGAIFDNISTNGTIAYFSLTYNQGTFIGAANFLGYTNDATLAANFTMMHMTTGGILPEYGIAGNNSGFNAIFIRWLSRFMRDRHLESVYQPWLCINAAAAWNVRRTSDKLSWCQWLHPSPAGTNFYAWDCVSSISALLAAPATQTNSPMSVPTDYLGYWPLDDASGNSARDATSSGNNGTIVGATWNAGGKRNSCLSFNGISSYVRIQRPVTDDFSIAFWVRTTQTASSGQWYNGKGLVDGDASGVADDFGTALVGGKFAFGVGNPDTTVLSTSTINDGAWHFCVATRQQSTGLISVYVDGNLQATASANRNSLTGSSSLLFGEIASGGNYFTGSLDEIEIFPRALGGAEVSALYQGSSQAPSSAPANLSATAATGQIELNWSGTPLATSYNVKRSTNDGGPYVTLTNLSSTSYADTTTNSRTFYYVVSAVNDFGESPNSAQAIATPLTPIAWFRADAISTLGNGSPVAVWPDFTGNGHDAMQLLAANQPTFQTSALNGLPVVHFNSSTSSYLWFFRPVQDDFTITFVYRSSQGIGAGTDFWTGAGLVNGEQSGSTDDFGISLNANGQVLAGTGNPDVTAHSATGFANGLPHVVTFKRVRSTGLIYLYVDGGLTALSSAGKQSLTAPNFLLMGGQATLNNFLTGDIAEVQIYASALADNDRVNLERALKCKYGIGGANPLNPPIGLTGAPGNRQIALNWLVTAGASDYEIWRSIDGGTSYQLLAGDVTNTSYLDVSAANGQTNYYKIAADDGCGTGMFSTVASISLPLPALSMSGSPDSLTITWPSWASDWTLYCATNLTPPVTWTGVTNPVIGSGGNLSVTMPLGTDAEFFRLASP